MTAAGSAAPAGDAVGRTRGLIDAAALVFSAGLAALYVVATVLDPDEAIMAAIAVRMRTFGLPVYAAGWEPKPPLACSTYASVFALFGDWNMFAVHVVSAAFSVATAYIVGVAARRLLGATAFAPAVVAYALLRSFGGAMGGAANSEMLMSPFLAGGLLILLSPGGRPVRSALLGGALLAVAVLFKPPVALYGLACVVAVLLTQGPRRAWTTAWAAAIGALLVLGLAFAHLAATSDLHDAWICNVDVNSIYMAHGRVTSFGARLARLGSLMLRERGPWSFVAAGAGMAIVAPRILGPAASVRRWCAAIAVLLATGLHIVTFGGYFFHHYWVMVHPVIAVAAAAGWELLTRRRGAQWATWLGRGVAVLLVLVLWLPEQRTDKRHLLRDLREDRCGRPAMTEIAKSIESRTSPSDPIWIWGWNPQLYVVTRRVPATRFVTCGGILWGSLRYDVMTGAAPPDPGLIPEAWPRLFDDLETYPPRLIVDATQAPYFNWKLFPVEKFPKLAAYLAEHYTVVDRPAGYTVYERKER